MCEQGDRWRPARFITWRLCHQSLANGMRAHLRSRSHGAALRRRRAVLRQRLRLRVLASSRLRARAVFLCELDSSTSRYTSSIFTCIFLKGYHSDLPARTYPVIMLCKVSLTSACWTIMAETSRCIHCWSGPRSLSTSLLYAFAERTDVEPVDEPLYAHFLRLSGAERPYRDQVLSEQSSDGELVLRKLLAPRVDGRMVYCKHMSKHAISLPPALLRRGMHFLLIREPSALVRSFSRVVEPTLEETGLPALVSLYSLLRSGGREPPVVHSEELRSDPEGTLRALCSALGLPWQPEMLSWPSGPRHFDGCWAPWVRWPPPPIALRCLLAADSLLSQWYASVHASTGFAAPTADVTPPRLSATHASLVEDCQPFYRFLAARALKPLRLAHAEAPPPPLHPLGLPDEADPRAQAEHSAATHACVPDERNAAVLVGIRDGVSGAFQLHSRPHAKVSVLDAGFILGDGVWEGMRLHRGVLLFAQRHMDRLWEGCAALCLDLGINRAALLRMIYATVDANGMTDGVHVRLMCTRGLKPTPFQDPRVILGGATIVVLAEHKRPQPPSAGLRLATVHVRRGAVDVQDPGLNSHSKLNCITACIAGAAAGADEALMLDEQGYVATCNSTNFLMVRKGELWAPLPGHHMPGITKAVLLQRAVAAGIPVRECQFSLAAVYGADEAFVTGTFAGLLPVDSVDGRRIGSCSAPGSQALLPRLIALYQSAVEESAAEGRLMA